MTHPTDRLVGQDFAFFAPFDNSTGDPGAGAGRRGLPTALRQKFVRLVLVQANRNVGDLAVSAQDIETRLALFDADEGRLEVAAAARDIGFPEGSGKIRDRTRQALTQPQSSGFSVQTINLGRPMGEIGPNARRGRRGDELGHVIAI